MSDKRPLKILLVMTANMNLGDTVLSDNDYYLIKKALGRRASDILRYSIFSHDPAQVRYVDAVVFAGGIVKTTDAVFKLHVPEILREAAAYNVPVFMSAIGTKPFVYEDEASYELVEAMNLPCIKGISSRDDIDSLKRDYLKPDSKVPLYVVSDPACWCAETYQDVLPDRATIAQNTKIGLGITRHLLFEDYLHPEFDREKQLEFWKQTALLLESRGYEWTLFTNGDTYDEQFALEVLDYIGHGTKEPVPMDGTALVKMISGFRGLIAIRMHSNIIAYSLGIPSIGVVWDQKLRFWGKRIGYPERFLEVEDFTPERAVDALQQALGQKMGLPPRSVRMPVYKALKTFIRKYCKERELPKETVDYAAHMLAPSLGGMDIRYRGTNAPEAFTRSVRNGYLNFGVDVRLTADDIAVCINRWHRDTFHIMNLDLDEEAADFGKPLSYEEFRQAMYYYRFHTQSFCKFCKRLSKVPNHRDFRVMVSLGRPSARQFPLLIEQITGAIAEYGLPESLFLIRLERTADIEKLQALAPGLTPMFFQVNPKKPLEETLAILETSLRYCAEHDVPWFSMKTELFNDDTLALIRRYPVRLAVTSYVRTEKVIEAIQKGVDLVGSQYYDVAYMKRLTQK